MPVKAVFIVLHQLACILTRLPRASISWWRWTSVRYLGYYLMQTPDGSCDFRFSIACIINQLCNFVKRFLKSFFKQAWKRFAYAAWKRTEPPLTTTKPTRFADVWPDTQRELVGLQRTGLDTAGLCGTSLHIREQVHVRRRAILPLDVVHDLVINYKLQLQQCSIFLKMLIRVYRLLFLLPVTP